MCSCDSLERKAAQISPGDSPDKVLAALGPPGDRQFQGQHEAWQYRRAEFGHYGFKVVWFYKGKVTGLTTYQGRTYLPVNWERAPDRVIEFRER